MSIPFRRPLRGIIPPMVTPLQTPTQLDVGAVERLVEHILTADVAGLFILGTSGEGPNLGYRVRRQLIELVCKRVRDRVPVLVGITDTSFAEAVDLARFAGEAGASALVAAPPYYFQPCTSELLRFVERLSESVPLPLFLYNMPAHAMDIENVVGLKDSSGDVGYLHAARRLCSLRDDWTLLVGPEHLTAEFVLFGGHGGVNGGANFFPKLFVDLYKAAANRDVSRVMELQEEVLRIGAIYEAGCGQTSVIRGIKCALNCMGITSDVMAEPAIPLGPCEHEKVRRIIMEP